MGLHNSISLIVIEWHKHKMRHHVITISSLAWVLDRGWVFWCVWWVTFSIFHEFPVVINMCYITSEAFIEEAAFIVATHYISVHFLHISQHWKLGVRPCPRAQKLQLGDAGARTPTFWSIIHLSHHCVTIQYTIQHILYTIQHSEILCFPCPSFLGSWG